MKRHRATNTVFGMGTGRCGTWSLYRLFQAQSGVAAIHEGYALPWDQDLLRFYRVMNRVTMVEGENSSDIDTVAWVASYLLPYVPEIMSNMFSPKIVCLKRGRESTIRSFQSYMPTLNHFTAKDSIHWNSRKWAEKLSAAWPKYDLPWSEAIGAYWDEYYKSAEFWEGRFPDNFRVFETEDLNTVDGVKAILDFAGIPAGSQRIYVNVKLNQTGSPKGFIKGEPWNQSAAL